MPPIDVKVRWNSTYKVLKFATTYRHVIDDFVATDGQLRNETYQITAPEWSRLEKLTAELKVRSF